MKNHKGFATLGTALMLLTLISLNTFISTKGSVLEQQSSNNAYYAEQSFQHAEMGITQVKSNITQYLAANSSVKTLADIPSAQTTITLANVYSTSINGNRIISTGYVNGVGMRRVSQLFELTSGSGGGCCVKCSGVY